MSDNGNQNDSVDVVIHGSHYQIKTSGEDSEYINHVAQYVDQIMTKIAGETKVNSVAKLAILAALNITDELFSTLEERDNVLKSFEEKALNLSKSLSKLNNQE